MNYFSFAGRDIRSVTFEFTNNTIQICHITNPDVIIGHVHLPVHSVYIPETFRIILSTLILSQHLLGVQVPIFHGVSLTKTSNIYIHPPIYPVSFSLPPPPTKWPLNKSSTEIIWNANLMQQGNFINAFLAKNTSIKLPCCIKLAFQIISWGRCAVKQASKDQPDERFESWGSSS